jgi:sulfate/thiosulfate transport system ATP-binding protein
LGRIEVRNLSKRYGAAIAVDDVSFQVADGELCALLGPSGSGKSTVLRIIAGLERPTRGDIFIGERRMTHAPPQARNIGFVFQNYALFNHLDVFENVAFGLRIHGEDLDVINGRAHELLMLFGLEGYAHRMPSELSGGQRQRVAMARALAARPNVLLLDEPFAALDAKLRADLRDWLRATHEKLGTTCLFVTHDQEEAATLADRVIVMSFGRIEQTGSPRTVYDQPASDFVADFIGPMNSFQATVRRGKAMTGCFQVDVPPKFALEGMRVVVRIRPHDVELRRRGLRGMSAVVRRVAFLGDRVRADVQLTHGGPQLIALLPSREADKLSLQAGRRVSVRIKAARVSPEERRASWPPP